MCALCVLNPYLYRENPFISRYPGILSPLVLFVSSSCYTHTHTHVHLDPSSNVHLDSDISFPPSRVQLIVLVRSSLNHLVLHFTVTREVTREGEIVSRFFNFSSFFFFFFFFTRNDTHLVTVEIQRHIALTVANERNRIFLKGLSFRKLPSFYSR